jgi:hypothetical protein
MRYFRCTRSANFLVNPVSMNVVKQDVEINGNGFAPALTVMY